MCLQGFLCLNAVICLDLKPGYWIHSASNKIFSTTWRKAIRKLWCLPNTTSSNIVPYLVGAPPLEEQLFRRVAKMNNAIRQGFNQ